MMSNTPIEIALHKAFRIVCSLCLLRMVLPPCAGAAFPTLDEQSTARRFSEAKFERRERPTPPIPGLEVVENHNIVQKDGRLGRPLRVGDLTFARGLYCHAPSKIVVRLPGPGHEFAAVAGIDRNDTTAGGQGSVVFAVSVNDQEQFTSDTMRASDIPVQVLVPLDGARDFLLEVRDAGDGFASDQADWADARVFLEDHREIWLSDLPMAGGPVLDEPYVPPFSFNYGGVSFADFRDKWDVAIGHRRIDARRMRHWLGLSDPATRFVATCEATEYSDFPVVEWTLTLKNAGDADSPAIEAPCTLDLALERPDLGEFTLNRYAESPLFHPETLALGPGSVTPGDGCLPYFAVSSSCGNAILIAVGWPGRWGAVFTRDDGSRLRAQAGLPNARFVLRPGEEVRLPRATVLFSRGEPIRAQNIWRRWCLTYNTPCAMPMGVDPFAALAVRWNDGVTWPPPGLDWLEAAGARPLCCWIQMPDAPASDTQASTLKTFADAAHAEGVKLIVEPGPDGNVADSLKQRAVVGCCETVPAPVETNSDGDALAEIRRVDASLESWRALRDRFPNAMFFARGSYDPETLRNAIPVWPETDAKEARRRGWAAQLWIPYAVSFADPISRSDPPRADPAIVWRLEANSSNSQDPAAALAKWRSLSQWLCADYGPLSPYPVSELEWSVWLFQDEDRKAGLVHAYRPPASPYDSARYPLRDLQRDAAYAICPLDGSSRDDMTGLALSEAGLPIALPDPGDSVAIEYRQRPSLRKRFIDFLSDLFSIW